MWEHTAMTIELSLVGTPMERDSLMAKYNFLGLPGSVNPPLESSSTARMREGNFHYLQSIAKGLGTPTKDAETIVQMLESALPVRDQSLDFIFDQIADVALFLQEN